MLRFVLFNSLFCACSSRNPSRSGITLPMSLSSSWSCSRCTFLNPPSQKLSCEMCLSAPVVAGSSEASSVSAGVGSSAGRWPCFACTYLNRHGNAICEVCGIRALPFSRTLADDLDPDELAATGSVFLPLQRCGSKRPNTVECPSDVRPVEKCSRSEQLEHMDISGDSNQSSDLDMLKILSYNVWFREDLEVHRRMEALGNLIEQHLPDFICFQEVTPNIYEIFERSKWWKAYKCSISQDLVGKRPYFCMQLSKLPVEAFNRKPFANSIMGRELCSAEIKLASSKRLVIATTHLESPCPAPPKWNQMYSPERILQAKESLNHLKNSRNVIFAGDMNWDDKLDGDFPLPDEDWVDAWIAEKKGENGWTYDTKSNKMLSGNRPLQKRLDRFMCKLKDFRIEGMEMLGTEAIPGLFYAKEKKVRNQVVKMELPVYPSDHYGLLLTIRGL